MSDSELNYGEGHIAFLEELWGDGYLSPGGPLEVKRLLAGIELTGKTVLDIGSGTGGITLSLAREYGAAKVIGIDVEEPVCHHARQRIDRAGFGHRVEIRQISPTGPIPVADESIDIVFSKDSIVHIPDKETLAKDAMRMLVPGGWFVASDWLIGHDDEPSPEMIDYLRKEDLGFGMASPTRYQRAFEEAGFVDVALSNRNRWYLEMAREELKRLEGVERDKFDQALGDEDVSEQIALWQAMLVVLETGEHCPHHIRGRKPL